MKPNNNHSNFRIREPGQLNARGIIAIAMEGTITGEEHHYFSTLQNLLRQPSRYEVHLLPTDTDNKSSPVAVRNRMLEFMQKKRLKPSIDKTWLVCDTDNWPMGQIRQIAREASQGSYGLAISNPCFELWLLLHHEDVDAEIYSMDPKIRDKCKILKKRVGELRKNDSRFHTTNLSIETITAAVQRAQHLLHLATHSQPLPPCPGTFVHRIIESIAELRLFQNDDEASLNPRPSASAS